MPGRSRRGGRNARRRRSCRCLRGGSLEALPATSELSAGHAVIAPSAAEHARQSGSAVDHVVNPFPESRSGAGPDATDLAPGSSGLAFLIWGTRLPPSRIVDHLGRRPDRTPRATLVTQRATHRRSPGLETSISSERSYRMAPVQRIGRSSAGLSRCWPRCGSRSVAAGCGHPELQADREALAAAPPTC